MPSDEPAAAPHRRPRQQIGSRKPNDRPTVEEDEVEASRAPLIEHLTELRSRLIKALVAFVLMFFICFAGAKYIYNMLVWPYVVAVGSPEKAHLVYTHGLEYLFTQIQVAAFGAGFLAFPVIAGQIYKFVAPGLYKNERRAFLPYLVATPVLFVDRRAWSSISSPCRC